MNTFSLLFSNRGRINRFDWWTGHIMAIIAIKGLCIITHFSIPHTLSIAMFSIHNITIGALLGILYIWIHISLNMKRWRDLEKPGWYVVFNYIPLIGFFVSIVILGFFKSVESDNE